MGRGRGAVTVFRFKDSSTQEHTVRVNFSANPPTHRIGEKVTVAFDPASPRDAKIISFQTLWLFPAVLGGFADGRLLVGGQGVLSGRAEIARLLSDGAVDPSFHRDLGGPSNGTWVNAVLFQPSGLSIVVGTFGAAQRLLSDGSPDPTFSASAATSVGASAKIQADGRIIIASQGIVRLMQDGSVDKSFRSPRFGIGLEDIALDSEERIYVGPFSELHVYSGQLRVTIPPSSVPTVFERTPVLGDAWEPLFSIPARTPFSYRDPNYQDNKNNFFRVRPGP